MLIKAKCKKKFDSLLTRGEFYDIDLTLEKDCGWYMNYGEAHINIKIKGSVLEKDYETFEKLFADWEIDSRDMIKPVKRKAPVKKKKVKGK